MTEADLRRHLSRQTDLPVGLLDVLRLDRPRGDVLAAYEAVCQCVGTGGVLIDLLTEAQLPAVGAALLAGGRKFVIGSSGVESALCAAWAERGEIAAPPPWPAPGDSGPVVAVCGSCSPVTGRQIEAAKAAGFAEIIFSPNALGVTEINSAMAGTVAALTRAIEAGRDVVLHTHADHRVKHTDAEDARLGTTLGHVLRLAVGRRPVNRVVVAGGDTSGRVAQALGITSLEMIAPLTRGAPLCRARSTNKAIDGLEVVFKGGQIGPPDFFARVRNGSADPQ